MNCRAAYQSEIQRQRTIAGNDAKKEHWFQVLKYYCINEVESRGGKFDGSMETKIRQIAEWLSFGFTKKPWLLLCGGVGTGKTTISKAIKSWYSYLTGGRKVFDIYSANSISKMVTQDAANYEIACKTPRIIIDDLGVEEVLVSFYGNALTPIVDLLYERYAERKITVLSTNLSPKEIGARYGERIIDRMKELAFKINFENSSYRERN